MEIHRKFADIENIQYILMLNKESSVEIFSRAFTEIPIDGSLISGFLSAIGSFGQEIGGKVTNTTTEGDKTAIAQDKGGLEELSYRQFKIIVVNGIYIRTAILLLKSATPSLKEKVRKFIELFEHNYADQLKQWSGKVPDPDPIIELIEQALNADLLYTHNIVPDKVSPYLKSVKKDSTGAMIIRTAESVSFQNTFKVREMLNRMAAFGVKEVDTFNSVHDLRKQGIIFAINPRTQYLIEQFKPMIDALSKLAKQIMKEIYSGNTEKAKIEKKLKISELTPYLVELRTANMLQETIKLSDLGEIIITLINLLPEI